MLVSWKQLKAVALYAPVIAYRIYAVPNYSVAVRKFSISLVVHHVRDRYS